MNKAQSEEEEREEEEKKGANQYRFHFRHCYHCLSHCNSKTR
jgi:hypothetical protein